MELAVRDATAADAEAITRILNAILKARIYTALDTRLTVDKSGRSSAARRATVGD